MNWTLTMNRAVVLPKRLVFRYLWIQVPELGQIMNPEQQGIVKNFSQLTGKVEIQSRKKNSENVSVDTRSTRYHKVGGHQLPLAAEPTYQWTDNFDRITHWQATRQTDWKECVPAGRRTDRQKSGRSHGWNSYMDRHTDTQTDTSAQAAAIHSRETQSHNSDTSHCESELMFLAYHSEESSTPTHLSARALIVKSFAHHGCKFHTWGSPRIHSIQMLPLRIRTGECGAV